MAMCSMPNGGLSDSDAKALADMGAPGARPVQCGKSGTGVLDNDGIALAAMGAPGMRDDSRKGETSWREEPFEVDDEGDDDEKDDGDVSTTGPSRQPEPEETLFPNLPRELLRMECSYSCGATRLTTKWGKSDGTGDACWPCFRTFRAIHGGTMTQKQSVKKVGECKDTHELFFFRRKKQEANIGFEGRRVRVTKAEMRILTKQEYEEALHLPDDYFLAWKDYKQIWGKKVMTKLKHVRQSFKGIDGVRIPGGKVMKITKTHRTVQSLEKVLVDQHDISSEGEMDDRFDEVVGEQSLGAAEGASCWDIYKEFNIALPDELMAMAGMGRISEGSGQSMTEHKEQGEQEEEDAGADDEDEEDDHRPQKHAFSLGGRRHGKDGKPIKKKKGGRPRFRIGGQGRAPGGRRGASGTTTPKPKEKKQNAGGGDGRGRKSKTDGEVYNTYQSSIDEFVAASNDDDAMYADDPTETKLKNFQKLIRDAKNRKYQALKKQDEESVEKAKVLGKWYKKLQGCESLLKGYRNFLKEGPSVDFLQTFQLAQDHANREPKVELPHPLPVRRQVHLLQASAQFGEKDNTKLLYRSELKKVLAADQVDKQQLEIITEGLVGLLKQGSLSTQEALLQRVVHEVMANKTEFSADVLQEITELQRWLDNQGISITSDDVKRAQEEVGGKIVHQLKHHEAGKGMIERAKKYLEGNKKIADQQAEGEVLLKELKSQSEKWPSWKSGWNSSEETDKALAPLTKCADFVASVDSGAHFEDAAAKKLQAGLMKTANAVEAEYLKGSKLLGQILFKGWAETMGSLAADKKLPHEELVSLCGFSHTVRTLFERDGLSVRAEEDAVKLEAAHCVNNVNEVAEATIADINLETAHVLASLKVSSEWPTWTGLKTPQLKKIDEWLQKEFRDPAVEILRKSAAGYIADFKEYGEMIFGEGFTTFARHESENTVHMEAAVKDYACVTKLQHATDKLASIGSSIGDPCLSLQCHMINRVADASYSAAFVISLGMPGNESTEPETYRVGGKNAEDVKQLCAEVAEKCKRLEEYRGRLTPEQRAQMAQSHAWLPVEGKVIQALEGNATDFRAHFFSGLKDLAESDIKTQVRDIAAGCPLSLEQLEKAGTPGNTELAKQLLQSPHKGKLKTATLLLNTWATKGIAFLQLIGVKGLFASLKPSGLLEGAEPSTEDVGGEMTMGKVLETVQLGKKTLGCTLACEFTFQDLPRLLKKDRNAVNGDEAKALAEPMLQWHNKGAVVIPDSLITLVARAAKGKVNPPVKEVQRAIPGQASASSSEGQAVGRTAPPQRAPQGPSPVAQQTGRGIAAPEGRASASEAGEMGTVATPSPRASAAQGTPGLAPPQEAQSEGAAPEEVDPATHATRHCSSAAGTAAKEDAKQGSAAENGTGSVAVVVGSVSKKAVATSGMPGLETPGDPRPGQDSATDKTGFEKGDADGDDVPMEDGPDGDQSVSEMRQERPELWKGLHDDLVKMNATERKQAFKQPIYKSKGIKDMKSMEQHMQSLLDEEEENGGEKEDANAGNAKDQEGRGGRRKRSSTQRITSGKDDEGNAEEGERSGEAGGARKKPRQEQARAEVQDKDEGAVSKKRRAENGPLRPREKSVGHNGPTVRIPGIGDTGMSYKELFGYKPPAGKEVEDEESEDDDDADDLEEGAKKRKRRSEDEARVAKAAGREKKKGAGDDGAGTDAEKAAPSSSTSSASKLDVVAETDAGAAQVAASSSPTSSTRPVTAWNWRKAAALESEKEAKRLAAKERRQQKNAGK